MASFAGAFAASHGPLLIREWEAVPRGEQSRLKNAFEELGRRLNSANPDVLIVGQPTRGVDIGAIEFIHNQLIKMRDAGKAILLVSVELDEIRSLSDRILVMFDGNIVGEADPATATDEAAASQATQRAWLDQVLSLLLPNRASWNLGPVSWYALRTWVELGFRALTSVGWRWGHTRRADPARRRWFRRKCMRIGG